MKTILLIIPYFGKWPIWFDAYLVSIAKNPTINWLCPTDCELPKGYPENIKFLPTTLEALNEVVNNVVDAKVPLSPRKFCDLKPAYGDIFKDEIQGYDFWGFCDMDIIWGDIRAFISDEIQNEYDIISSRKYAISGHFNIFKNSKALNKFYKTVPKYKELFELNHINFDEYILTEHFKKTIKKSNNTTLRIKWDKILCNQEKGRDSHQEYYLDKWQWQHGKMIDITTNEEVMYLHFINWKRTMKTCDVNYTDNPSQFYISYNGIHYKDHSIVNHILNNIKNVFNGYWIREKRRSRKLKFKSYKKRVINKLKKHKLL